MSDVIIDSGILIASSLVDEPLSNIAQGFLLNQTQQEMQFNAPQLLRAELVAVLRKAVFQKRIAHEEGRTLVTKLLRYPIQYHEDDTLLIQAYEIARRFNLPRAYDSQYLALAERLNCEFWTADETLYNSISARFSHIRWLGNFKAK